MKSTSINKTRRRKVIGIILTYNCENMLEELYKRVPRKFLDKIILVDDGSKDHTVKVAKKLGIPFYTHSNLGYGGNVKYAINKALDLGADYIVEIHGDGQYDPSVIPQALKKMEKGYSLLLGSRFVDILQPIRDKMPIHRYVANILLSSIYRLVLQLNLSEFHTGFHIYSKDFISKVGFNNTSNGHLYSLEIIFQAQYKKLGVCEIPIKCNYKNTHTSVSMKKSIGYSFGSLVLSVQYLLAKVGFKYGIFASY